MAPPPKRPSPGPNANTDAAGMNQDSIIITVDAIHEAAQTLGGQGGAGAQTLIDPRRAAHVVPIVVEFDSGDLDPAELGVELDPAGLNQDSIVITADALASINTLIEPKLAGPAFSETLAGPSRPSSSDATHSAHATHPPNAAPDPRETADSPIRPEGLRIDSLPAPELPSPSRSSKRSSANANARHSMRSVHDLKQSLAGMRPYDPNQILQVIGDYDVLSELGRGGMGVVYKAYARRLQRYVAIKMIRAGEHASPIVVARFINEAMLAARLQHPNITAVYDSGETEDGASYFAMEFVEGRDLGHYLEEGLDRAQSLVSTTDVQNTVADVHHGKLSLRVALIIIEKTARALHHAHQQGIIHRDIKPDNIIIDTRLEPHITDFGIAKALEDDKMGLTTDGDVMGTPYYMSPEQAGGELKSIGPHSDVYSLGAMLFHVITGRVMFEGPTAMAIMIQVMGHNEPPKPSALLAKAGMPPIPPDLETICLKAVEKSFDRRYPTALAFADDLRAFLEGQQINARPLSVREKLQRNLQRNRPLLVAATLAFALVITLAAAFGIGLIRNIERTSDSLQQQDTQQALSQAATLERAIRVNMLQGRADLARELMNRLGEDASVSSIAVARLDKSPAYSSASTRRQVENRLERTEIKQMISQKFPELQDEIEELKRRAFPNIDQSAEDTFETVEVNAEKWSEATKNQGQEVTYINTISEGKRELVVLKPITNDEKCQACHGETDADRYGANQLRAVVILHRPLDQLDAMISENRRSTWMIGAITAGVVLSILFALARFFGIGLGKRRVWKSE